MRVGRQIPKLIGHITDTTLKSQACLFNNNTHSIQIMTTLNEFLTYDYSWTRGVDLTSINLPAWQRKKITQDKLYLEHKNPLSEIRMMFLHLLMNEPAENLLNLLTKRVHLNIAYEKNANIEYFFIEKQGMTIQYPTLFSLIADQYGIDSFVKSRLFPLLKDETFPIENAQRLLEALQGEPANNSLPSLPL